MGAEKTKKVEFDESTIKKSLEVEEKSSPKQGTEVDEKSSPKQASTDKSPIPIPDQIHHKASDSKPTEDVEKIGFVTEAPVTAAEKKLGDVVDRDDVLARVVTEKRLALIKAWEESEKTKAENKAYKKLSSIGAWEDCKRTHVDAELKKIEEKFEKKKAEYAEKMNNKKAEIHKAAEEKKAIIEAQRGENFIKVEEMAAKFRATGSVPKKLFFACFNF